MVLTGGGTGRLTGHDAITKLLHINLFNSGLLITACTGKTDFTCIVTDTQIANMGNCGRCSEVSTEVCSVLAPDQGGSRCSWHTEHKSEVCFCRSSQIMFEQRSFWSLFGTRGSC